MPAVPALSQLLGISNRLLSREENFILEADLFVRVCQEIKEFFRKQYSDYLRLMHFSKEKEDFMLDTHLLRFIVDDILLTKEYTVEGIANCIKVEEDILYDVITGRNITPSVILFRKIIELHRIVRSEIYLVIIKKLKTEYSE